MKLSQLAAKPQLVKITIDDEETVQAFGESVEFWIYDRQSMETFMKLANVSEDNMGEIVKVINDMVLDEKGKRVLTDDLQLPTSIMFKVIEKVVTVLGNLTSQTLKA
jgi:hypothetical protein